MFGPSIVARSLLVATASETEVHQVSVTGRRCRRIAANGELVWPERLELSLFNALKAYPNSGHCSKPAKRHPRRNRFISEFIYLQTREYRTPKQVGSRIQQLKETCDDPEIQNLINQLEFLDLDLEHGSSNLVPSSTSTLAPRSPPTPPPQPVTGQSMPFRVTNSTSPLETHYYYPTDSFSLEERYPVPHYQCHPKTTVPVDQYLHCPLPSSPQSFSYQPTYDPGENLYDVPPPLFLPQSNCLLQVAEEQSPPTSFGCVKQE